MRPSIQHSTKDLQRFFIPPTSSPPISAMGLVSSKRKDKSCTDPSCVIDNMCYGGDATANHPDPNHVFNPNYSYPSFVPRMDDNIPGENAIDKLLYMLKHNCDTKLDDIIDSIESKTRTLELESKTKKHNPNKLRRFKAFTNLNDIKSEDKSAFNTNTNNNYQSPPSNASKPIKEQLKMPPKSNSMMMVTMSMAIKEKRQAINL